MAGERAIEFKNLNYIMSSSTDSVVAGGTGEVKLICSGQSDIVLKMGKKNEWLSEDEIYITSYRGNIQIDSPFASEYKVFSMKLSGKYLDRISGKRLTVKGNQKLLLASSYDEYKKSQRYANSEIANGMLRAYMEQFFLLLIRDNLNPERLKKGNKAESETVSFIITYLKEHIGEDIKFPQMVKKAGLSSTGLKQLFKEYTGMGVMQYYNYLKIEKAKNMLVEGELNATQIASILGYESLHYFSRQFKNITGVAPSVFVKRASSGLKES